MHIHVDCLYLIVTGDHLTLGTTCVFYISEKFVSWEVVRERFEEDESSLGERSSTTHCPVGSHCLNLCCYLFSIIMRASWEGEMMQQIMKVELELQARTDEGTFAGLKEWVDQRAARVFTDVKEKKSANLVRKRDDVTPKQRNNGQGTKVVVNLSGRKTDETEEGVFSLGLNYAIASRDLRTYLWMR